MSYLEQEISTLIVSGFSLSVEPEVDSFDRRRYVTLRISGNNMKGSVVVDHMVSMDTWAYKLHDLRRFLNERQMGYRDT